ncbi:efflux RND transporter periplasmic adaptor subunit [Terrarubrum flagellatum]|uniref:efflux RND transporter periplasmic adaptor subunit n=1 Tax=Terrirubrum flagellatum TaxID=2895980 RepID=UPI0031451C55
MRWSRVLLLSVCAAGASFGGAWWWFHQEQAPTQGQQAGPGRGGGGRGGGRRFGGGSPDETVPVLASKVIARDVPVHRDGIGNVQAYASITVRSQVDGRLLSVEFREGQDVKAGDVLARIDPAIYQAQYDQAVAKKAQDEANVANARIDLERYEKLAATNAGSKQQADGQKAMVAQLEAQIRSDQAAIDNAKTYLNYTTIRSPIDGRTGIRLVDAGNIVRAGDATGIVTIAQVKPISVLFSLPQRDFGAVNEAMAKGEVKVEAMEADGRSSIAVGTLEVVDNQIDTTTGTFKLKARFANEQLKLWPGQFVSARVQVALLAQAKVIPTPALRRGPDGFFVYIVDADSKAMVRQVKASLQDEEIAVITDGLQTGESVITTGFARLSNGKAISVSGGEPGEAPAVAPPPRPQRPNGEQPQERRRRNNNTDGGQTSGDQPARGQRQRS